MALSAAEIRAAAEKRRKVEEVAVEELGGTVRLRALSAADWLRGEFETKQAEAQGRDPEEVAFGYIARSWIDENGALLFPLEEGVALVRTLDSPTYTRLLKAVLRLNGRAADAIEDSAKN